MMILFLAAATTAMPVTPHGPPCRPAPTVAGARSKALIHPLGAEPPATQVLAVYREVGGCSAPVVVRRDVGAPAR